MKQEGGRFSLSNRRLFVFRVLYAKGQIQTVPVRLFTPDSERVCRVKWDRRLGRKGTKWDRSFSSTNGGEFVQVASKYIAWQNTTWP